MTPMNAATAVRLPPCAGPCSGPCEVPLAAVATEIEDGCVTGGPSTNDGASGRWTGGPAPIAIVCCSGSSLACWGALWVGGGAVSPLVCPMSVDFACITFWTWLLSRASAALIDVLLSISATMVARVISTSLAMCSTQSATSEPVAGTSLRSISRAISRAVAYLSAGSIARARRMVESSVSSVRNEPSVSVWW